MQQDGNAGDAKPPITQKRPARTSRNRRATRLVRVEMAKRDMVFKDLARVMEQANPGSEYTAENLTTRIHRGTFTVEFLIELADALKMQVVLVPNQ